MRLLASPGRHLRVLLTVRIPVQYLATITIFVVAILSGCDGNGTEILEPDTLTPEGPNLGYSCHWVDDPPEDGEEDPPDDDGPVVASQPGSSVGTAGWECTYFPDYGSGGDPDHDGSSGNHGTGDEDDYCSSNPDRPSCDPSFYETEPIYDEDATAGDDDEFNWDEVCQPIEPGCEWRPKAEWTSGELATVKASIDVIRQNGCTELADRLAALLSSDMIQLWDKRVTRWDAVLYGRVDNPTGIVLLWTGYDREPDDNVNWTRTLAHEGLHTLDWDHGTQMTLRVQECSGA